MAAKYELKRARNGETYFNLKAANGEIILSSEMYKTKSSALNGIEAVRKNSPEAKRYEKKISKSGKCYFILKAGNHQPIGKSEMYESEKACDVGIESVKKNGPLGVLDDQTP